MKTALLYGSSHGKTRKVIAEVLKHLAVKPDVFDVKEGIDLQRLAEYDLLAFFCPTYGDEELQDDFENFLVGFDLDLTGKQFVICELGNYYGYDDFSFGALHIIRRRLLELNGRELCEPLSLDSFPRTHWGHLSDWVNHLNEKLHEHVGH
jgi:flavodoxin